MRNAWPQSDSLRRQSRLSPLIGTQEQFRLLELTTLLLAGFLAASFAAFVDFSQIIPGFASGGSCSSSNATRIPKCGMRYDSPDFGPEFCWQKIDTGLLAALT